MRFMIIVRASKDSEAGKLPSTELLRALARSDRETLIDFVKETRR